MVRKDQATIMTITRHFAASILLLAALLIGCDDRTPTTGPGPQTGLPVVSTKLGTDTFDLEVANTDQSRETGLMYRDSMPNDHGMLFVFPDDQVRQFWMENTRIPLDIAFLDASARIISIKSMLPLDLRLTSSDGPAKYAIEMNVGAASAVGLKVGDQVVIPKEALIPPASVIPATTQSR
jgi:uncharacterized membrane protein (UPF0127 family)